MGVTRYRDGDVTITLDGALEDLVKRAVDAASGESVRVLQRKAQEVADRARADWYAKGTGVRRKTGKSGDVQVVTTVTPSEVVVSVGSTDTRVSGGKPRVALIHRPGPLSLVEEQVDQKTWWAWKRSRKPVGKPGSKGGKDWIILVPNPDASDGKALLPELVVKPAKVALQEAIPELTAAFAAKVGGR